MRSIAPVFFCVYLRRRSFEEREGQLPAAGWAGPPPQTHLSSGLVFADAEPKVDRVPIRTIANLQWQLRRPGAKRERVDASAKATAARQGGPSPQPPDAAGDGDAPLAPAAGEVAAGGVAAAEPEDSEAEGPRALK